MTLALLFAAAVFLTALAVLLALDSTFQITFNQGQDVVTQSLTVSADEKVYAQVPVAAGATVTYLATGDPDAVAAYVISPDFTGTLTTTNSTGASDVVALAAGVPLFWNNQMGIPDTGRFANRNPWLSWSLHNTGTTDGTLTVLIMRAA